MTLSLSPKWLKRCESTRTNFRKKWLHRSRFALQKVVTSETGTPHPNSRKIWLHPSLKSLCRSNEQGLCLAWTPFPTFSFSQKVVTTRNIWLHPTIFGYTYSLGILAKSGYSRTKSGYNLQQLVTSTCGKPRKTIK